MKVFRCVAQTVLSAILAFCVVPETQSAGPVDDLRVSQLEQEIRELQQQLRQQERRIETLEAALRSRSSLAPIAAPPGHVATAPVDANAPWLQSANWNKLRVGMTEEEVIRILGPPTSVRKSERPNTQTSTPTSAQTNGQTLFYTRELDGSGFLSGRVTVFDRRVAEIQKPAPK